MTNETQGPNGSPDAAPLQDGPDAPAKKTSVGGVLVFIAMFAAVTVLGYFAGQKVQGMFAEPVAPRDTTRYEVRLRGDEPQRGPDDALVTIIEFSDFECPYCAKATAPLEAAMGAHEGDVRLLFKHFPLPGHKNALPAARTAWAAHQQGAFWDVHDWLFESRGAIIDLPKIAKRLELDAAKLGADMQSDDSDEAVDDDRIAGGMVGIRGTPAFVVNGHIYGGALSEAQWDKIIDAEKDAAKALVAEGTARGDVYATMMKTAEKKRGPGPLPTKGRREGEPSPSEHYRVEAGEGRPALGPSDALVTIVEFADFHCPFCAKASKTVRRVMAAFPEDVRVVFRHHPLPMHQRAKPAAAAAMAAHRQGKFWEMHDLIFERDARSDQALDAIAEELGLDMARYATDKADPAVLAMIDEDTALAKRFGANGTPAFFINGRYLAGARSAAEMRVVVEEERDRAAALVKGGTPRAEVFAKVMAAASEEVRK